jgi:hypothetical protein
VLTRAAAADQQKGLTTAHFPMYWGASGLSAVVVGNSNAADPTTMSNVREMST